MSPSLVAGGIQAGGWSQGLGLQSPGEGATKKGPFYLRSGPASEAGL